MGHGTIKRETKQAEMPMGTENVAVHSTHTETKPRVKDEQEKGYETCEHENSSSSEGYNWHSCELPKVEIINTTFSSPSPQMSGIQRHEKLISDKI